MGNAIFRVASLVGIVIFPGCGSEPDPPPKAVSSSTPASFQAELYQAALREGTKSFAAFVKEHPDEKFYAYALYTNNDLRGVHPFANTLEALERAGFEKDSEEKWVVGEWQLELQGSPRNPMSETTHLLIAANDAFTEDPVAAARKYGTLQEFRRETFRSLNRALLAIREAGVFRGHAVRDELAFLVYIGDPESSEIPLMFEFSLPHLAAEDIAELRDIYGFE